MSTRPGDLELVLHIIGAESYIQNRLVLKMDFTLTGVVSDMSVMHVVH